MAGNAVRLEFAGDASKLQQASKKATAATEEVAAAAKDAGADYDKAGAASDKYGDKMANLGSATTGAIDAIDSFGAGLQAAADIQDFARDKAAKLARAELDVEQAMADGRQATIDLRQARVDLRQANQDVTQSGLDLKQAEIDQKQAVLDAKTAQDEYNKAVKEHGKNSDEAKQASIDLTQANQDLAQADADAKQAGIDLKQATTDKAQAIEDATQANLDAKSAQLDLNDAMHEADPPELQQWADMIGLVTPLLSAVVGVLGLVTAAQWLWNSALFASPVTWIVLGIIALVAIIVVIATKTTWFQDLWRAAWGGIKAAASAVGSWFSDTLWPKIRGAFDGILGAGKRVWGWLQALPGRIAGAFASVGEAIARPFRSAFNGISRAWNSTVGSLSWTVPGWVPGVGGNTISAPRLPTFHTGGKIPGLPGTEVPFMGLAGETVLPIGANGGQGEPIRVTIMIDSSVLVDAVASGIARRGGRGPNGVQFVLGGGR
jgi:hypothetical protein